MEPASKNLSILVILGRSPVRNGWTSFTDHSSYLSAYFLTKGAELCL